MSNINVYMLANSREKIDRIIESITMSGLAEHHTYETGDEIISASQSVDQYYVLMSGYGSISVSPRVRSGVLSLLVSGDVINVSHMSRDIINLGYFAVSLCTVASINSEEFVRRIENNRYFREQLPRVRGFNETIMLNRILIREHKSSYKRVCSLIYELYIRSLNSHAVIRNSFFFPIGLGDIADATNLTIAITSRVIEKLRDDSLISLRSQIIEVTDVNRLKAIALND